VTTTDDTKTPAGGGDPPTDDADMFTGAESEQAPGKKDDPKPATAQRVSGKQVPLAKLLWLILPAAAALILVAWSFSPMLALLLLGGVALALLAVLILRTVKHGRGQQRSGPGRAAAHRSTGRGPLGRSRGGTGRGPLGRALGGRRGGAAATSARRSRFSRKPSEPGKGRTPGAASPPRGRLGALLRRKPAATSTGTRSGARSAGNGGRKPASGKTSGGSGGRRWFSGRSGGGTSGGRSGGGRNSNGGKNGGKRGNRDGSRFNLGGKGDKEPKPPKKQRHDDHTSCGPRGFRGKKNEDKEAKGPKGKDVEDITTKPTKDPKKPAATPNPPDKPKKPKKLGDLPYDDGGFPVNTRIHHPPKQAAPAPQPPRPAPPQDDDLDEMGFPMVKPKPRKDPTMQYASMVDNSTPESRARTAAEAASAARKDAVALREKAEKFRKQAQGLDDKPGMAEKAQQFRAEAARIEDDADQRIGWAQGIEQWADELAAERDKAAV
jgi:hypothetical protein